MRTYITIALVFIATCFYSVAVIAHMVLFRDKAVFYLYARWWSKLLLKVCRIRVKIEGADSIQPGQRYVYIANHSSLFDIPILIASVPDNIRIMYKKELEKIPVFGWCLRLGPYIAVVREKSRSASETLAQVVESLRDGSSVLVFPEGTRSPDGAVGEFKRGAFSIALQSGKPLMPVSICGSAGILPARTRKLRGGDVTVVLGEPVVNGRTLNRAEEKHLVQSVQTTITNTVNLHL